MTIIIVIIVVFIITMIIIIATKEFQEVSIEEINTIEEQLGLENRHLEEITDNLNVMPSNIDRKSRSISIDSRVSDREIPINSNKTKSRSNQSNGSSTSNNWCIKKMNLIYSKLYATSYSWALIVDVMAFIFFFLLFFDHYNHNSMYRIVDSIFQVFIFPIIFALLLIISFMHCSDYSLFTTIIKESFIFKLLGECSLPIYLYHNVIIKFYFPLMCCGIRDKTNPYTLSYYNNNDCPYSSNNVGIAFGGIITSILFSILMQKVFQDRLIIQIHMWITSKLTNCRTKINHSDSVTNDTTSNV